LASRHPFGLGRSLMNESFDRFVRQADLVPQAALANLDISVTGVGAIGRQIALQLASLGARNLQLVDFDVVELTNVTTQGYLLADLGQPKVEAAAKAIGAIDPAIQLELVNDRYRPILRTGAAVFCCVDSITTRAAIWRAVSQRCEFWGDGRMLG